MHHIHLGNYIHIATYDSLTRNKQIAIYICACYSQLQANAYRISFQPNCVCIC